MFANKFSDCPKIVVVYQRLEISCSQIFSTTMLQILFLLGFFALAQGENLATEVMASQVVGQIADPGSVSSMAYKMGVLFASMSSPFFNEGNQLPEDSSGESEGGCQAKLSEQLRQKITGLIEYSQNLLEQIFSKKSDARTSICRVYNMQIDALNECLASEENPLYPSLMILQTICSQFSEVFENSRNLECLSEISYTALENQCATECQHLQMQNSSASSSGQMAQNSGPVQTMNSTEGAPSQQQQNPTGTTEESEAFGQICNLELCVSDCVGLQMGECEETGDSENGVGRLRQFSSQLDGLQMLYAIQSQVESSASASTIIAKVVPPKCAQLIAKSVGSANFVANHDIQEKGQQAYYEKPSKPSFLELLSGKPLGENFARR